MAVGAGVSSGADINIIVKGLPELRAKLGGPPYIYEKAVRKHQRNVANEGARRLRSKATKLTGKLKRSIRPKTDTRGLLTGVTFDPIASQGKGRGASFRSGWAFDASSKFQPRNGGQTSGWVRETAKELAPLADSEFAAAAKEIEAAWNA